MATQSSVHRALLPMGLAEHGLASLSVDRIARAAEVYKTSVYRRWPMRGVLVAAALERVLHDLAAEVIEAGSLRDDLLVMAGLIADFFAPVAGARAGPRCFLSRRRARARGAGSAPDRRRRFDCRARDGSSRTAARRARRPRRAGGPARPRCGQRSPPDHAGPCGADPGVAHGDGRRDCRGGSPAAGQAPRSPAPRVMSAAARVAMCATRRRSDFCKGVVLAVMEHQLAALEVEVERIHLKAAVLDARFQPRECEQIVQR